MSNDLNIVVSDDTEDEQYVQVPIKRKDFGDFVSNLLGQPETIEKVFNSVFEVDLNWLKHMHYLLDQRIHQQTHAELVDFSAAFRSTDKMERKITDLNVFLNFNEVKLVTTEAVKITWTYLISFPNKSIPEKQEITLVVTQNGSVNDNFNMLNPFVRIIEPRTHKGIIVFSIAHTERTWGDDIETLLSREVENVLLLPKHAKIKKRISIILALFIFAVTLMTPEYIEGILQGKESAKLFSTTILDGVTTIDEKLNIVLQVLNPDNKPFKMGIIFGLSSLFLGLILASFTLYVFEYDRKSFLLITEKDKQEKVNVGKKEGVVLAKKIFSFMAAIIASLSASYLYYYLNLPVL